MKFLPVFLISVLMLAGCLAHDEMRLGPDRHLAYEADEIEWVEGPASLEPGAEMAILEGDPSERGMFTLRFKLPDGFRISPHWHPNYERVTVLSGTFHLGMGERFDPETAQALPAGSYTTMPPEMVHYAVAEGETVIQLTSIGPWLIHYINPEDDPRTR